MIRILTAIILLSACGSSESKTFCATPCGAFIAAANGTPQYPCSDYRKIESFLILELSDKIPNACSRLSGLTAWELPGFSTRLGGTLGGKESWASGWAECANRKVMFHTGNGYMFVDDYERKRNTWNTAFTHELVHAAQNCESPMPVDPGRDPSHSNWSRDGLEKSIFNVIERMEKE